MNADSSFLRYLESKKTVDDRALNARVWARLEAHLRRVQAERPVRVVEIGTGIGTMLERLVERGALRRASFTGVDAEAACIEAAGRRLPAWTSRLGWQAEPSGSGWRLRKAQAEIEAAWVHADERSFARLAQGQARWDVLIANAFLDLVPLAPALRSMMALLVPGGFFYFSINFDGVSIFLPPLEPALDEQILAAYHQTMDERRFDDQRTAGSQSGRQLLLEVPAAGGAILEAGASDWIVLPREGSYPADEAFFLEYLLGTIESALAGGDRLKAEQLKRWIAARRGQLERTELIYIAHQLDVCGVQVGSAGVESS